ncbi:MAG TPA: GGDEF domain-containing protein [Sulfurospirillum arcachonense]|nr:GGDEF domain-containing protein [Sulfurospirillum arcachonense]HIP44196.1 GGDEF domain-containing protein [Sulfurospirillum arcachonense]
MKLVLSLLIVTIYWCLDAYQAVINFNITFTKALLLDYDQSNTLVKLIIVIAIFIFSMIQTKTTVITKENKQNCTAEELNAIYSISDTILAPIPLHKQLNTVVDIMEKELQVKTSFIASFENDKILLLNTNESLSQLGIKTEYKPHHNELRIGSIEKLLSTSFLEKRESIDDIVKINGIKYRAILQTYKDSHSKRPMGITVILLEEDNDNNYENFLKRVCEQIAFTVNLTKKKEEAIKAQSRYNAQFSSMDTELGIPSNSKLQEMIEYEIKRSQRYGTQLSIMLIEVDHMKNLSNIFSEKETVTLKKEIVSLLKKGVRETDMFGKWTDNHFAIIAPDVDFRATKSFANKLNRKLDEHRFAKVGKVTCSYGITSFSPKDSIGDFRKRAEKALKEATSRGGNSIEVKILV